MKIMVERPFHTTVAEAIYRCPGPSSGEILRLLQLIRETKIPEGHNEIITAIDRYFNFPGAEKWSHEINETKSLILKKKELAEIDVAAKKEELVETTFGELQLGDEFISKYTEDRYLLVFDGENLRSAVVVSGPRRGRQYYSVWKESDLVQKIVCKRTGPPSSKERQENSRNTCGNPIL